MDSTTRQHLLNCGLDIDEADFCVMEDGHPDEVALPEQGNSSSNSSNERTRTDTPATGNQTPQNMQRSARALGRSSSGGAVQANGPSGRPPQTPAQGPNVPQRQVQQATGNYVNRPSSGPQQGRPLQGPGTSSSMNSNGQQPRSVSSVGPSAATATSGSGATAGAAASAAANARTDGNAVAAMPAAAGGDTLPTAFFSAKSIKSLPEEALKETNGLAAAAGAGVPVSLFNPKLESPSIRKTPGFDHNSTKPIVKSDVLAASQAIANGGTGDQTAIRSATGTGGPAQPQPQQPQARHAAVSSAMAGRSAPPQHLPQHHQQVGAASGANQSLPRPTISGSGGSSLASNVLNPALDSARRVGAPGMGPASPLANRGTFRAPTMKRPLNSDGGGPVSGGGVAVGSTGGVAAVRTPLADVSNLDGSGAVATVDGGDLKRLKADHR